MAREIASMARPSKLRLAGFLALTLGGLLLSLGSLMDWATVQPFDTPTRGVDLWEGTVTLAIGFVVLFGMILMRLVRPHRARQAVAVVILALGLIATALAGRRPSGRASASHPRASVTASPVPWPRSSGSPTARSGPGSKRHSAGGSA
jgi:hypothetical protein